MRPLLVILTLGIAACVGVVGEPNGDVPDGGEVPHDAGDVFSDSSMPPADASAIPPDAAAVPPDAGAIPADAATLPPDAATLPPDAAIIAPDAATIAPDASMPVADAGPSSTRQTARPLGSTSAALGFYEYLPPGYDGATKVPLLVFTHGIGENGNGTTELSRVLANGPPKLIAQNQWPADRPFIVLSPQHPNDGGCPGANEIHDFIAFGIAHYAVDPTRVYLTGLSCGAIGAWNYLGNYLDQQIAALVPIAGDGQWAWGAKGCDLGKVPIWAFHGDADPTVNVNGSKVPMNGLAGCPVPPRQDATLTLYPGVGHDSWTRTYDLSAGHDPYTWLLQHHK